MVDDSNGTIKSNYEGDDEESEANYAERFAPSEADGDDA